MGVLEVKGQIESYQENWGDGRLGPESEVLVYVISIVDQFYMMTRSGLAVSTVG